MTRTNKALTAWAVLCVSVAMAVLVGHAYDHEATPHAIFTRHGITLDCERITDITGRTFYDSCVRVP